MLLTEVNNLSGLRLTKSNADGIFLHFDSGENQVGIRLDNPNLVGYSVVIEWAKQQFSNQFDLLEACKKVQQYNEAAKKGRLHTEAAHDYWDNVMSYVDAAIAAKAKL